MTQADPLVSGAARKEAAEHWWWGHLFLWAGFESLAEIPLAAVIFVLFTIAFVPVLWAWRRWFRKAKDADDRFVRFHADQMDLLSTMLLVCSLCTCCIGFPVFLVPALFIVRAGRQRALSGEWWQFPLFGWIVRRPA